MQEERFKVAVVARMKHGVLYEAIKKRGWSVKKAAEFLGIRHTTLCSVINLRKKPPFLFSENNGVKTKQKARELTEKLMELTGMTFEDLFPEAVRTDEFFDQPKVFERMAEIPLERLVGYAETLALPLAPDEALMEKEDDNEFLEIVNGLRLEQRHDVQRVLLEGGDTHEAATERGVGIAAVSANLQKAKKSVRESLEKRQQQKRTLGVE